MVETLIMLPQTNHNNNNNNLPPNTAITKVAHSLKLPERINSNNNNNNNNNNDIKHLSEFDKLNHDLTHNDNLKNDFTIGKRIGFYTIGSDLGNGNFSQVKLGIHLLTKDRVAIKILDKTKLDEKTQRLLFREITCMEKLHHPNIIRLYEVINTNTRLYICMEYAAEGELYTKINREGKLNEKYCKYLFSQIVAAVDHMHSHNIVHRDIKAENVFFADFKTIKVGDFGFSTYATKDQQLNTFCGSPPYAAPELFRDDSYIGVYVDVWALGVLLYFMCTSLMPFKADTVGRLKRCILNGEYVIPSYVSDSCQLLIRGILKPIPADRFTIKEIMESAWLDGQTFPSQLEPYQLTPTLDKNELKREEKLARQYLEKLGISEEILIKRRKEENIDLNTFENSLIFTHTANTNSLDLQNSIDSSSILTDSTLTLQKNNEKLFSQNYLDSQEFKHSIDGAYRIIYHRIQKQLRNRVTQHNNHLYQSQRSLPPSLMNNTNTLKENRENEELGRRYTLNGTEVISIEPLKLMSKTQPIPLTQFKSPSSKTNLLPSKQQIDLKLKSSYGGVSNKTSRDTPSPNSHKSRSSQPRTSLPQTQQAKTSIVQKQISRTCSIL